MEIEAQNKKYLSEMDSVLFQHQTQRERIQKEIVNSNQNAIEQLEKQMTENRPLHESLKKAVDTLIARESYP